MDKRSTYTPASRTSSRKSLGQYMTPGYIADFIAAQLPSDLDAVVDLAAGDCALLAAVRDRDPQVSICGFEIDTRIYDASKQAFPSAQLVNADGLVASLDGLFRAPVRAAIVGNPPFTEFEPNQFTQNLLRNAFPGLTGKMGHKRSELYFLARSLLIAKATKGMVAIVMPIGFADGDIYTQFRRELMSGYAVRSAIEFPPQTFAATEARTILLVVDTSGVGSNNIQIARYDMRNRKSIVIRSGVLVPGERLDARYHEGRSCVPPNAPTLGDLGVTVVRGRVSRKEAEALNLDVIHTSNLREATLGMLDLPHFRTGRNATKSRIEPIIAQAGDVLLSRTGTRVNWSPVVIKSGASAITDHVFRIRIPKRSRNAVLASFRHPSFSTWLESISKGVCATVLTKRELLSMPIFSPPFANHSHSFS